MIETFSTVRRPVLRWHGGKWRTAPWIIGHFPKHATYHEPFGGAASVLLRKGRSHTEIYNDLDREVVNLFKVLQSPAAARLISLLHITPYARSEFDASYVATDDPVERARRLVIRSIFGHGTNSPHRRTGFRNQSRQSKTSPAADWANYPEALRSVVDRLRGVTIECRPAIEAIQAFDAADTLHYADPPYLPEVRDEGEDYAHEMSRDDHLALLETLGRSKGMVVVSGYPSSLYDQVLKGWRTADFEATIDKGRQRTERIWMNKACTAALSARNQPDLFALSRLGVNGAMTLLD